MYDSITHTFFIYLIIINLISFFAYWRDKNLAKKGSLRIPESILIGLAAIGGSIGAITGMYLFHHKTKKPKFKYGIPIIIALQIFFVFCACTHLL